MKAVRFHGRGDLRYELDVPEPQLGPDRPGHVKLKPVWVGICGTDLNEYLDGPNLMPTTPHPITGEKVPLTIGHEFSAVVEEVGADVKDYKPGDRVVVQPIIYDGTCGACKEGLVNCCYSNGFIGLSGWGGGLSEHIVVPQETLYHIPDSISFEVGALIEPLSVGWHAVKTSPFKPGQTALIIGAGPIGLAVIQALKAHGASNIIVSEVSPRRKEHAREFGATHVLDPTTPEFDMVAHIRSLTDGAGAHIAYDCAGVQHGFDQAVHATRARATIVNIAVWERPCLIRPNDFVFREKRYMGMATFQNGDFQEVIDAIAVGKIKPEGMITKKIKMTDVIEQGFETLIKEKDKQVKILIEAGT